ncbi:MAG: formylglycine-generating enzyme family protein [Oligoflexales bacterium]|nr:formylglycine-generating enzyme family protein [Oligoflexales bacterium]
MRVLTLKFFVFASIFLSLGIFKSFAAEPVADFKLIPAGSLKPFWLNTKKPFEYQVAAHRMQIHQVTNLEYIAFLKKNPQWRKSLISPLHADAGYLAHFQGDLQLSAKQNPNAPVTSVSWFSAQAYCESIDARLATVQEWEYVAAADEKHANANKYPQFLERILAWYGLPRSESLAPVKSIYKNHYGIYDMHGLVWEWVEDFNSNTMTGESREDSSLDRNLFCGASSANARNKEDYAAFMRFAFRGSLKGSSTVWNLGFRCAKGASK